ncbi:nephrin isoform X2 [Hyalella azteca]|uniref:Nephrin isoform X2 n=1 Tax=Hyalella azteca TaxID=294128 RepID=A0A8B7N0B9_HYAAZ|nr:nephrin isoform X2 [Hyalella azteca]
MPQVLVNQRLLFVFAIFALLVEGLARKQSFRVRPSSVEAVVGSDVLLLCEVDDQQGDAQWTKHGFAMGFNRTLPGLPRYQMVGNAEDGVHNLRILNVSLDDDGEFQCQVTPFNNARQIRAPAVLTVLVPPSSLTIERSEASLTVQAGQSLSITCKASDAKPAAAIKWRKNGVLFTPSNEESSEVDGSKTNLKTKTSKITITPTAEDNDANFTCVAHHPALTITNIILQTSVVLDVQYPPNAPEVIDFAEDESFAAGQEKVLTCRSRGGNPLPDVYWYKNGVELDRTFEKHKNYAVNEYRFDVDSSDNRAVYECRARNAITTEPKTTSITMRVNFPPDSVVITGPASAKVGDRISLSCKASNSNPAAQLSLLVNGRTPPGTASSTPVRTENWGFTNTANVTNYLVEATDKDLVVACYAHNHPLGTTKVDTKTVTILRPPGPPIIVGYNGTHPLKSGERLSLTCQSDGGNPLATLTWFKGNTELPASGTRQHGDSSISDLDVVLQESDNRATYSCRASNDASTITLTTNVTLAVYFPPASVKVTVSPDSIHAGTNVTLQCESSSSYPAANVTWWRDGAPLLGGVEQVKDGLHHGTITSYSVAVTVGSEDDGAIYTCQASNNWAFTTHDSITLDIKYAPVFAEGALPASKEVSEGESISLNATVLAKPSAVTYTWHFGGQLITSSSVMNITNISRTDDGIYTVKATNSEGSVTKDIALKVKFAPVILTKDEKFTVNTNDSVELTCRATGLPKPTFSWHRGTEDISSKATQYDDSSVLTIQRVSASDTGRFLCRAKNEVGKDSANFTVLVNHKPVMDSSGLYERAGAELGGTGTLRCRATGSPSISFTWFTRDNTPIEAALYSRFQNRYSVSDSELVDGLATYESVLTIANVTIKDHGIFQCQAMNSHGYTNTIITLEGTTAPDAPSDLKVVNTTHDSVLLQWVSGYNGGLQQSFRIRYRSKESDYYQYADVFPGNATVFSLTRLERETTYVLAVQARNSKGESAFTSETVQATTKSWAALDEVELAISRVLEEKSSYPKVVTLAVSSAACLLIVINVVLIACVLWKRRRQNTSNGSIDKGSNKSNALEMYAPSSYNGTVNAETLSSISEKSRTSTGHEDDSVFDVSDVRPTASPKYLIDRLEPPVQYASQGPLQFTNTDAPLHPASMTQPHRNQYDLDSPYNMDLHNQGLSTLDRRGNLSSLPHAQSPLQSSYMNQFYSPDNLSMNRHNNSLTRQGYHASENPYPRTQAPKLQFPKDYIRNGSAMNSSLSPPRGGGLGYAPASPDRMSPPALPPPRTRGHPMLTTFAGDHIASSTLPMEQRGHLV